MKVNFALIERTIDVDPAGFQNLKSQEEKNKVSKP